MSQYPAEDDWRRLQVYEDLRFQHVAEPAEHRRDVNPIDIMGVGAHLSELEGSGEHPGELEFNPENIGEDDDEQPSSPYYQVPLMTPPAPPPTPRSRTPSYPPTPYTRANTSFHTRTLRLPIRGSGGRRNGSRSGK